MGWVSNDCPRREPSGFPWFTLAGLALLSFIYLAFGPASEGLRFDRQLIAEGQYWRLLTGHLVHVDGIHFTWNLLAFGLIGLFLEWPGRTNWRKLLPASLALMVCVTVYVWIGRGDLQFYLGISALLNGLLALALYRLVPQLGRGICILFALGAGAKIIAEIWMQTSFVAETAWPSMPDAHLVGFLAGGLVALASRKLSLTQQEFQILPMAETDKDAA